MLDHESSLDAAELAAIVVPLGPKRRIDDKALSRAVASALLRFELMHAEQEDRQRARQGRTNLVSIKSTGEKLLRLLEPDKDTSCALQAVWEDRTNTLSPSAAVLAAENALADLLVVVTKAQAAMQAGAKGASLRIKVAERALVAELYRAYEAATGKAPTTRTDAVADEKYGPFFDFVQTAMGLLNRSERLRGLPAMPVMTGNAIAKHLHEVRAGKAETHERRS